MTDLILSPKGREKLKKILQFEQYAPRLLKIRDKKRNIIPFSFNEAQKIINKVRHWVKKNGYLERYIFLKARQKGISTYWEADIFHAASTTKQQKCAVIAHKLEASQNLYDMTLRYYQKLEPAYKPVTKNTNEKKLKYQHLESEIKVMTAGMDGEDTGRSDTLSRLHCSEVAFWNNAKETLLSLLQTVPDELGTLVVLESTANGLGGEFHERWQEVYTNPRRIEIIPNVAWYSPDSGYTAIFISWLIDNEYTRTFAHPDDKTYLLNTITEKEKNLIELGASYEHLNYRRYGIKNKAGGDESKWTQEYPSTPEESFIASGRPVIDPNICHNNMVKCPEKPYKRGELIPVYDFTDAEYRKYVQSGITDYATLKKFIKEIKFQENNQGLIKLYYDLKLRDDEQHRFAGGSDIAEGLEQGDRTVCKILDRKTMRVAITWAGHLATNLYAEELHKMQLFLNNDIYFAIERNNHGLGVITKAFELGVKLYYEEDFSKGVVEGTDRLGFRTSDNRARSGSRTLMINDLVAAIVANEYQDEEREFWGEALTFVYDAQGRQAAQDKLKDPNSRCYDDRIFAAIGMWKCHLWLPNFKRVPLPDTNVQALLEKIKKRNKHIPGTTAMSR